MTKQENLTQRLDFLDKIQTVTKSHSFFDKISCPRLQLESFVVSQECFVECVLFWTKALILLMNKVPLSQFGARFVLLENLYDEHGEGNLDQAHVYTFEKYCSVLRLRLNTDLNTDSEKESFDRKKWDTTTSKYACSEFNKQLEKFIQEKEWYESFACLGAIEFVYSHIAKKLNAMVHERFKIPQDKIFHYKVHEELDIQHAKELLKPTLEYGSEKIQEACIAGVKMIETVFAKMSIDLKILTPCKL